MSKTFLRNVIYGKYYTVSNTIHEMNKELGVIFGYSIHGANKMVSPLPPTSPYKHRSRIINIHRSDPEFGSGILWVCTRVRVPTRDHPFLTDRRQQDLRVEPFYLTKEEQWSQKGIELQFEETPTSDPGLISVGSENCKVFIGLLCEHISSS